MRTRLFATLPCGSHERWLRVSVALHPNGIRDSVRESVGLIGSCFLPARGQVRAPLMRKIAFEVGSPGRRERERCRLMAWDQWRRREWVRRRSRMRIDPESLEDAIDQYVFCPSDAECQ